MFALPFLQAPGLLMRSKSTRRNADRSDRSDPSLRLALADLDRLVIHATHHPWRASTTLGWQTRVPHSIHARTSGLRAHPGEVQSADACSAIGVAKLPEAYRCSRPSSDAFWRMACVHSRAPAVPNGYGRHDHVTEIIGGAGRVGVRPTGCPDVHMAIDGAEPFRDDAPQSC